MLRHGTFKASDLVKIPSHSLDEALTCILSHIVRAKGDKKKLTLIRQAVYEVDQFLVECLSEGQGGVN